MNAESEFTKCEIMLTRHCNLRCKFCFEKNDKYLEEDSITYEDLTKLIDFCNEAQVKYVFFTGGEPLLYPHIASILRYIQDRRYTFEIALATNGILFADFNYCKQLIDCGLKYIDISVKGKDSHEWLRDTGKDFYRQQILAIKNISALPVEFTCSMVITPESVLSICDRIQTAFENGARQFSFTFFIDNNDAKYKNHQYLRNNDPFLLIESFISQKDRLDAITTDWWVEYSFPICIYTEKQQELLKGKLAAPCHIFSQDAIVFNPKMELLPCDMYSAMKMGKFGVDFSTYEEFKKLIKSRNYQSIMEQLSQHPSIKCKSCPHLKLCYGGCPVLWKNYSFDALHSFTDKRYLAQYSIIQKETLI